jgi:hypothetical protein
MKQDLTRLIAASGFQFKPGFSGRVMDKLKQSVQMQSATALLTARISKMFYWVNIPMVAALLVLMLLFFFSNYRTQYGAGSSEAVTLNDYVYDFYISNN